MNSRLKALIQEDQEQSFSIQECTDQKLQNHYKREISPTIFLFAVRWDPHRGPSHTHIKVR